MTSFRARIVSLLLLMFAAVPAFAQENTVAGGLATSSSLGCLGVGVVTLVSVGLIAWAREAQADADQNAANDAQKTAGSSNAGH